MIICLFAICESAVQRVPLKCLKVFLVSEVNSESRRPEGVIRETHNNYRYITVLAPAMTFLCLNGDVVSAVWKV